MFIPKNVAVYAVGTIKYLPALSLNDKIGVFKILFRWSHSVWRLLIWDFFFFATLFTGLSLLYQFYLVNNPNTKRKFEGLVRYMERITSLVPLSFLLGFFVSTILSRWWSIISSVPWMTKPAFLVMSFLHTPSKPVDPTITMRQQQKQMRSIRLTIMRYMNLAWILQVVQLSRQVKERFKVPVEKSVCFCFSRTPAAATNTGGGGGDKEANIEGLRAGGSGANSPNLPLSSSSPGTAGDGTNIRFTGIHLRNLKQKSKHRCDHDGGSDGGESVNKETSREPTCIRRRMDVINRDPIVKKFFAPLVTPEEIRVFERMEKEFHETKDEQFNPSSWIPLQWAVRVLNDARDMNFIRDDRHFTYLCTMIDSFRGGLGSLSMFNAFNMPVGYTQVVTFAVYSYFFCEIISQQFLSIDAKNANNNSSSIMYTTMSSEEIRRYSSFDAYIPVMSIFKFIFYLGWFKMGLALLNPLSGDGKGEFPMSEILDYNLQVATQCAPADNAFFPSYLCYHEGSTAKDQIAILHKLSKIKYDLENVAEEPGEYEMSALKVPLTQTTPLIKPVISPALLGSAAYLGKEEQTSESESDTRID